MLDEIKQEAVEKDKIEALIEVVTSNYALMLFDEVEKAKIRLSSQAETMLTVKTQHLTIEEPLTRRRFERVIDPGVSRHPEPHARDDCPVRPQAGSD